MSESSQERPTQLGQGGGAWRNYADWRHDGCAAAERRDVPRPVIFSAHYDPGGPVLQLATARCLALVGTWAIPAKTVYDIFALHR